VRYIKKGIIKGERKIDKKNYKIADNKKFEKYDLEILLSGERLS